MVSRSMSCLHTALREKGQTSSGKRGPCGQLAIRDRLTPPSWVIC